jgi:quinol-cytochrome oxidoreductase complex cytochrome b subunit
VSERGFHGGRLGCLLGVTVAAVVVGLLVPWAVRDDVDVEASTLAVLLVLIISIATAGFLAAIGMSIRRTTRSLGINMLVGLTVGLPVLALFTFVSLLVRRGGWDG